VRLSMVPEGAEIVQDNFDMNVMKVTCFGHDTRANKTAFGQTVHPGNARGPCEYQTDPTDINRYDTGMTVPYNLKPGFYVLQTMMLQGNDGNPYKSCARLHVKQGDENLVCSGQGFPRRTGCLEAGGGAVSKILPANARAANFCYQKPKGGNIGHIDSDISKVPINVHCAGGKTCGLSYKPSLCEQENGWFNPKNKGSFAPVDAKFPYAKPDTEWYKKCQAWIDEGKWTERQGVDAIPTRLPHHTEDWVYGKQEQGAACDHVNQVEGYTCLAGKLYPGGFMSKETKTIPTMSEGDLILWEKETDKLANHIDEFENNSPSFNKPETTSYTPPKPVGYEQALTGECRTCKLGSRSTTATTTSTYH